MDGLDYTLSGAMGARAPPVRGLPRVQAGAPVSVHPGFEGPSYLTHIEGLAGGAVGVVSDDGVVSFLDAASGRAVARAASGTRVTQARAAPAAAAFGAGGGGMLVSCADGTLRLLDPRAGAGAGQVVRAPQPSVYLSLAASAGAGASLLAAGTELDGADVRIDLFDPRSPAAPVCSYTESHSDDVTALHFHPDPDPDPAAHAGILLSASTDGLVSAIDTTHTDEDDAVIAVGNTGASVARAGWGGGHRWAWADPPDPAEQADLRPTESDPRRAHLGSAWAVGDMQTLSLWDADKFDQLLAPVDVRTAVSLQPAWRTDYIIDATAGSPLDPHFDGISLWVGTNDGALALIAAPPSAPAWQMHALLAPGAHNDIVRCVHYDAPSRRLWSGGEDGRLAVWDLDPSHAQAAPAPVHVQLAPSDNAWPTGRPSPARTTHRWKPYG